MSVNQRSSLFFCATIGVAASAFAGDKENDHARMLALEQRMVALRANGGAAADIEQLRAEYEALSASLGGDRPTATQAFGAATPSLSQGALAASSPLCSGAAAPVSFAGTTGPIADVTTQTFTAAVSGVGVSLWDLDLTINVTHTFAADLDISLTSPASTVIAMSTDNGGGFDNVFAGTLLDDQVNDPITDHIYANLSVATPLSPEGRLGGFRGENPNGTWTLTIVDDAGADVGALNSWSLDVTALAAAPTTSMNTFSDSPGLAILDVATVSDTQAVAGVGTNLVDLKVYVEILHTFAADLDFSVTSPGGTTVILSTDNGGGNDDVFNGTLLEPCTIVPVTDALYVNAVPTTPVMPEGAFGNLNGQDANGVWTITITDDLGGDVGTLVKWDLQIETCNGTPPPPVSYCTAGTTTNGCLPAVTATNNPSLTGSPACVITVNGVEGQKNGILFYGLAANSVPWAPGSNSTLCVKAPTQRTGTQSSGGTAGLCNGTMTLNWDAYMAANVAMGEPWALGDKAYVQGWFRDPSAVKTTNLSDGLELTYQP